jgi:predicted transcriptional regulator
MNIQTEKLDLIEWISRLNDTSIIHKLQQLKEDYSKSKDWWDTLEKEELESIKRGLKDFEEGRTHSHETVRNIYGKYL